MRSRALLAATALAAGVFAPAIGSAQSAPSPGQIVQSLAPTGPPTYTKRGSPAGSTHTKAQTLGTTGTSRRTSSNTQEPSNG